jgi:V/A-type H+-transporting ATPase subunit D
MEKIKFTKGELKRQRDALARFVRYLPTLALKKQQLQMEIQQQTVLVEEKRHAYDRKHEAALSWSGLLAETGIPVGSFLVSRQVVTAQKNIAGVDIPIFVRVDFAPFEYDLFSAPLWLDRALDQARALVALREEMAVLEKGIAILRQELRIATQRVNLFEKVKIPQTEDVIRRLKIYLGDQMVNAVGRSKIAKRKIELALVADEVLA